jgi:hypothetical protein
VNLHIEFVLYIPVKDDLDIPSIVILYTGWENHTPVGTPPYPLIHRSEKDFGINIYFVPMLLLGRNSLQHAGTALSRGITGGDFGDTH